MQLQFLKNRAILLLITATAIVTLFMSASQHMQQPDSISPLQCTDTSGRTEILKEAATGELAALQILERPTPLPAGADVAFLNSANEKISFEAFRGKAFLLNLWATWCLPCREEMPALNKLQNELAGLGISKQTFEVVAINLDTKDPTLGKNFYTEYNIDHLTYYAEPDFNLFQNFRKRGRAPGLPQTILIDENGCERAILSGPADWGSATAINLITQFLKAAQENKR